MNILLSSVGRRSYLCNYFRSVLGDAGKVIATNSLQNTTGMKAADIPLVIPPANHPSYGKILLNICKTYDVKLVCSLHDWETPYLGAMKDELYNQGSIAVVPTPEIIDTCLDKFQTYLFSKSLDVLSPQTFLEPSVAIDAIKSNKISYPVILKPRWGQGSLSMLIARNEEQLRYAYHYITSELDHAGLSYLAHDENDKQVIIQEMIIGKEYGVDIINDLNGNFVTAFIKYKFAMRSGETDAAVTVEHPGILRIAKLISNSTRHPGIMDCDFFEDEKENLFLLEMNPRFGGGYPFSHAAGANIPAAYISWAKSIQPDPNWLKVKSGVVSYKDITILTLNK